MGEGRERGKSQYMRLFDLCVILLGAWGAPVAARSAGAGEEGGARLHGVSWSCRGYLAIVRRDTVRLERALERSLNVTGGVCAAHNASRGRVEMQQRLVQLVRGLLDA